MYKQARRYALFQVQKFSKLNVEDAEDALHNVWERAMGNPDLNWTKANQYFRKGITRELVAMAGLAPNRSGETVPSARGEVPVNWSDYVPRFEGEMDGNYAVIEDLEALGPDSTDAAIDLKRSLERSFSARDQKIVKGAFFEGYGVRELAEKHELSFQRIAQILELAKKNFKEILEAY